MLVYLTSRILSSCNTISTPSSKLIEYVRSRIIKHHAIKEYIEEPTYGKYHQCNSEYHNKFEVVL